MNLHHTQEDMLFSQNPAASETIIGSRSLAELIWQLRWQSDNAGHTEELFTPLNIWRDLDLCPEPLARELVGKKPGDTLAYHFDAEDLIQPYDGNSCETFPLASFAKGRLSPRLGRFYPKGLLSAFPVSLNLFRCIGITESELRVDLNHPLAGRPLDLAVTVDGIQKKKGETGGQCQDWLTLLLDGPGVQSRWQGQPTDFFQEEPFQRQDEQNDGAFYDTPRLVSHLDRQARKSIERLYGRLLQPGMRVLDLMSSWQSHLPAAPQPIEVVGLGLNEAELQQNPQLTSYLVYDLNLMPTLPFTADSFDAVTCTVSVEYLTQPLKVFKEIWRILKPGGAFILTFSNRWFPPKVVKIWTELLDYERLGLILEYFLRTGGFTGLETFSARGWPRPEDDKYYRQVRFSDPVFAAWGRKAG
jgi:SAM-dependent methyltransferase/FKBP-type peptidyl-prolyl cis-trans isomerase 2